MKLIQMQYSPDAFDSFVKQKLEEVEVDTSAASQHWKQMPQDIGKRGGGFNSLHFYTILDVLIMASLFMVIYSSNKMDTTVPASNTVLNIEENLEGKNKNIEHTSPVTTPGISNSVVTPDKKNQIGNTIKTTPKLDNDFKKNIPLKTLLNDEELKQTSTSAKTSDSEKDSNAILSTTGEKNEQNINISIAIIKDGLIPDSIAQKKIIIPPADKPKKKRGPTIIW